MARCDYCWREATYGDYGWRDFDRNGVAHPRVQPLCPECAAKRRLAPGAQLQCLHIRLSPEGQCYQCGADCRGVPNV